MTALDITIGICAYNEAQNIERSIRSIYDQKTKDITVREVIVVSSGSTDGTDDIVRRLADEYGNITLIRQEKREGKNSAINCYLENAGYDCIYAPDAIVLNRGPETEEDFLKQRIRVNIGEVNMKRKFDYDIPSWNKKYLMKAVIGTVKDLGFHPFKLLYAARLEMKARKTAEEHIDSGDADMNIWDQVATTKKL